MKFDDIAEFFGQPLSQQGQYTFYKGFKFKASGKSEVVLIGEFILVKIWPEEDIIVACEIELCWFDRIQEGSFASVKLYFLPEHTAEGRNLTHGQDEVISLSENVIIRIDDLISLIPESYQWQCGQNGVCLGSSDVRSAAKIGPVSDYNPPYSCKMVGPLCMKGLRKQKRTLGADSITSNVIVVNYASYCRYRGAMKRFEGNNSAFAHALVIALGGFAVPRADTRVVYCKETFEYPELEGHELLCNHLAPKFTTKKPKKTPQKIYQPPVKVPEPKYEEEYVPRRQSLIKPCHRPTAVGSPAKPKTPVVPPVEMTPRSLKLSASAMAEQSFLERLYKFMKSRGTPIDRLPSVGTEKLNLYKFYSIVRKVGGYEAVGLKRYWRRLYLEMGGYCSNNAAATATRKHYERFLLPFEQHLINQSKPPIKGLQPQKSPPKQNVPALSATGPELRPRAQLSAPRPRTPPTRPVRNFRRKNKTPVKVEKENVEKNGRKSDENRALKQEDQVKQEARTMDEIDSKINCNKSTVDPAHSPVRIIKETNKSTSYVMGINLGNGGMELLPASSASKRQEAAFTPGPSTSFVQQFPMRPAHMTRPSSQVHVPRPGSHQTLPAEILPSLRTLSELNISIVAADGTKISTGVDGRSALENLTRRPIPQSYDSAPKKPKLEQKFGSVFDSKTGLLTGSDSRPMSGLQCLKNLGSGFSIIPVPAKKTEKRPVPPLISIDKRQKETNELISNVSMLMSRPDLRVEVKGPAHEQPLPTAHRPQKAEGRPVNPIPEVGLDLSKKTGVSIYPVEASSSRNANSRSNQSEPKQPDPRFQYQQFMTPFASMMYRPSFQPNYLQMVGMANLPMVGNPAMVQLYKEMIQNGSLRPPMSDLERLIAMQQSTQKP